MPHKVKVCELISPDHVTVRSPEATIHELEAGDSLYLVIDNDTGRGWIEVDRPERAEEPAEPVPVCQYWFPQAPPPEPPASGSWRDQGPLL
jgi:hypothetical protein